MHAYDTDPLTGIQRHKCAHMNNEVLTGKNTTRKTAIHVNYKNPQIGQKQIPGEYMFTHLTENTKQAICVSNISSHD